MEQQVNRLAEKVWQKYQQTPPEKRLLIGIAGIPGSGKTTFTKILTARLNSLATTHHPAAFLPMDGFHHPRRHLSAQPDPSLHHARRGASFTLDAPKFLSLVTRLRQPVVATASSPVIAAPSFDHGLKDPVDDAILIGPAHRILLVEGNYLALDRDVWRDAARLFDELWFVDVAFDVARRRLGPRHLAAGIVGSLEEGFRRAEENDLVNGREIVDHLLPVQEVIYSVDDDDWAAVS